MNFQPRTRDEIYEQLRARLLALSGGADTEEGSILSNLLSDVADEVEATEFRLKNIRDSFDIEKAIGEDLVARIEDLPGSLPIPSAAVAVGAIGRLERSDSSGALEIPAGSVIASRSDDSSIIYVNTEDAEFLDGELFCPPDENDTLVTFRAVLPGEKGNCDTGLINNLVSAPEGVIGVTNLLALTNGRDAPTQKELANIARLHMAGLAGSQPPAIEAFALAFTASTGQRAIHAFVWEDPETPGYSELIVDDGSGTFGFGVKAPNVTGTVPDNGQTMLWFPNPIAASILQIKVNGGAVNLGTPHKWLTQEERGVMYIKDPNLLAPGDTWAIEGLVIYTGLIAELQRIVNGDPADYITFPGKRTSGTRIRVLPPLVENYKVRIQITTKPNTNPTYVRAQVSTAIATYGANTKPGTPALIADLICVAKDTEGVYNVKLLEPLTDRYPSTYRSVPRPSPIEVT